MYVYVIYTPMHILPWQYYKYILLTNLFVQVGVSGNVAWVL